VLTAYDDQNYFDKFKEIGFCAYLRKPIDFKELFAAIEKCSDELEL
jgi:AmiR/NasT family two-component response regulator